MKLRVRAVAGAFIGGVAIRNPGYRPAPPCTPSVFGARTSRPPRGAASRADTRAKIQFRALTGAC